MKKTYKALLSMAFTLLVIVSLATSAFAASPSITFKGQSEGFEFQPGSEFTETDLFDNFKNVMPGDVLTETITFTNSATDCDFVNLYMRAETHDEEGNPLSEKVAESGETVATMEDFLSQLSMKVWNGSELIYSSSPDQLDGLKENKFLGTFRGGETATLKIELTVPIELGNEYANRVGEVDWIFLAEAYDESTLSVRKVWSDGNENHAGESVTVNLLKNGRQSGMTAELNAGNNWMFTFNRLQEGYTWSVEEAEVPDGYSVSYDTEGTLTTITNTKEQIIIDPNYALKLTVKKVWNGVAENGQPDSVTVVLYNGTVAYDTVQLSAANNWTHAWVNPNVSGNWQVVETNVPEGYVPSYSKDNGVVTITNTAELSDDAEVTYTVRYIDDGTGLVIRVPGTYVGTVGDVIKMQDHIIYFQGYNFKWASKQNLTLTENTAANEIVYHYLKQVTLTVNFVDEDGNPIANPSVSVHEYGDKDIVIDPPHKNGYEPEVEHVAILDPMTDDMTVTVKYTKTDAGNGEKDDDDDDEWGKTVKDDDEYTVQVVEAEEIPLAVREGAHKDCLIPLLFMLLSLANQCWYVSAKKKHEKKMYELKCRQLGVDPNGVKEV